MIVGVPKETFPGETRAALVPSVVPTLKKLGCEVRIEAGLGVAAGYPDAEYVEKGAVAVSDRRELFAAADLILQVRSGGSNPVAGKADLELFRAGQTVVGYCDPLTSQAATEELAARGVQLFSMELMPRITRAQSMDALSAMATIAGYKAVLLAAESLPRMFPMLMTAAGTITAARVFVIGAGVAGLQAIATARRLGAVVSAYDVRSAVREQVQSVGGKFVSLELAPSADGAGGYAKALDEDFYRRQRELMAKVVAEHDVVITTAAIPGRKSPILVTAEMVRAMAPGSVVIDLAAERGGNCELTRPDEVVVDHSVRIFGPTNLVATVPYHASLMYAKTAVTFLQHLYPKGTFRTDEDEIVRETRVAADGAIVHTKVREAYGLPAAAAVGA